MEYAPRFQSATCKKRYDLGSGLEARLYVDVVPAGPVEYEFVMAIFKEGSKTPFLSVTSEKNSLAEMGGGSHFLCVFDDKGHHNYGSSAEWADEDAFCDKAMELVNERLSL